MFKFRLQRVLDMRVQSEQDAATRLAAARSEADAALLERLRLEEARDQGIEHASASTGMQPKVGQLQNLRFLVERLNDEIEVAQQEVEAAAEGVRERLEEYSSAFRERHMIDKLREKALETHRSEEVQADRKAMDSVALSRFIRARAVRRAQES
ncbi:MAG TPA: flagellar export protein FliJ [Longimicrobiaceae bacterium]|jgi:flagellar FliJ protein